jgi:protein TonB
VHTEGIEFPFPGYLNNIVRQIALNFKPSDTNSALRAEVMFLIYRNGSVKITRFVTRSGSYAFDLEAQGAIESAAANFGPLPDGFRDDVLPVVFSFDPRFLR